MRRHAALALLVTVAVGALCVTLVAASDDRDLAFTLGVVPGGPVVNLAPGAEACQLPIDVAEPFTGVDIELAPPAPPGPPLEATVRRLPNRTVLARGAVAGGYRGFTERSIALDRPVRAEQRIAVCLHNPGRAQVALFGGAELANRASHVELEGRRKPADLALVFTREPSSVLSQVPEIFQRASLFAPSWIGPWTYWLLAALLLLAAPALLARALTDAFCDQ